MMRMYFLFQLLSLTQPLFAQPDGLTEREKVLYINENFYKIYSNNLASALRLTQWAAETAGRNQWQAEQAYALLSWGVVSYLGGDYRNALTRYLAALELFEKLEDDHGIIRVCNELGVFYYKQKDTVNCFRVLDRAERLARERNDFENLGTNLGHRGAFLLRAKKYAQAELYFLEVFEIRKNTRDSVGLGYILLDLAEMATNRGNMEQAIAYINQSTEIREKINDKYGLAVNAITKGETFLAFGHHKEAMSWLAAGLRQAQEVGFTDLVQATHHQLAKLYHQEGNHKQAYEHLVNYGIVKDSLFNTEKAKAVSELQTQYETEKKERLLAEQQLKLKQNQYLIIALVTLLLLVAALVVLWRNRVKLKQQAAQTQQQKEFQKQLTEAVISLQEAERARFAKDLHDSLGQMISVVRLHVNQSREAWSIKAVSLLDEIHREIRNIAFALLPHTLITEGLSAALRELASRISQTGRVRVEVEATENHRLDSKLEVSLYRASQEWINNVLQYAAPDNIRIEIVQERNRFSLVIEDDGAGFDPVILKSGRGNGWKNIQSRIGLHNGTVWVESSPARKGTTFVIELPLTYSSRLKAA